MCVHSCVYSFLLIKTQTILCLSSYVSGTVKGLLKPLHFCYPWIRCIYFKPTLNPMFLPGKAYVLPVVLGLMEIVSTPFCILELLEWFKIPDYTILILEQPSPWWNYVVENRLNPWLKVVKAARHFCEHAVFSKDINPEIFSSTQRRCR